MLQGVKRALGFAPARESQIAKHLPIGPQRPADRGTPTSPRRQGLPAITAQRRLSLSDSLVELQSAGGSRLPSSLAARASGGSPRPGGDPAAAFEGHAAELLKSREAIIDPEAFVKDFLNAAGSCEELVRRDGNTEKVKDRLEELQTSMKTLLKKDEVLDQFTVTQLTSMTKAATALGIDLNADETVNEHLIKRQRNSNEQGGGMMGALADRISEGDQAGALKILRALRQLHLDYARISSFLGRADPPSQATAPALVKDLLQGSVEEMEKLDGLPTADVLLTELDRNKWTALTNRLESAGKALSSRSGTGEREMGAALTADAQLLKSLLTWAREAHDSDEVTPRPDAERAGKVHLDKDTRNALQDHYDFVPNADGSPMSGRAAPAVQAATSGLTSAHGKGGLENDSAPPHKLWFPQQDGVTYKITDQATGKPRDLHEGWKGTHPTPDQRHALRLAATRDLVKLAGGDRNLMLEAARVAHPSSLAGIKSLMNGPHCPLRLPDGTAGHFAGGLETSEFSFHKNDKGHLVVRCEYAVKDAQYFMPANGDKPVLLDRNVSHARVTVDVVLLPRGRSIALPAKLNYDLDTQTLDKALVSDTGTREYRTWMKKNSGNLGTRSLDLLLSMRELAAKTESDRIPSFQKVQQLLKQGEVLGVSSRSELREASNDLKRWYENSYDLDGPLPANVMNILSRLEKQHASSFAIYARAAVPEGGA